MIAEILAIKETKNPEYVTMQLREYQELRTINGRKLKSATKPKNAWGVFSTSLIEDLAEGDFLDGLEYTSSVSTTPFYEGQEPFTDGKYYENRFRATLSVDRQVVDGAALQLEREIRKVEREAEAETEAETADETTAETADETGD